MTTMSQEQYEVDRLMRALQDLSDAIGHIAHLHSVGCKQSTGAFGSICAAFSELSDDIREKNESDKVEVRRLQLGNGVIEARDTFNAAERVEVAKRIDELRKAKIEKTKAGRRLP